MPQTTTNGFTNGHNKDNLEMADGSFLFSSESVGEGHPGKYLIHFSGVSIFSYIFLPCPSSSSCSKWRLESLGLSSTWAKDPKICVFFASLAIAHVSIEEKCVFLNFLESLTRPRTRNSLWLCARSAKSMRDRTRTMCSSLHPKGGGGSMQIPWLQLPTRLLKGRNFQEEPLYHVVTFRSSLLGTQFRQKEVCV